MSVCPCGSSKVLTTDAVGRPSKRGPRCPRCDGVARLDSRMAPEHAARSQWAEKDRPAIPQPTLAKNRAVFLVQPAYQAFVEVPTRPAPLPSRYVKSEAETHPKDLPADHPRRIAYLEKIKETKRRNQKARRAKLRAAKREAQQ